MERVVVFGGYGAVGREAVALLRGSCEVVVAGRDPERARSVPGAVPVRVDLREPGEVERVVEGADAVLMCVDVANARVAKACLERGVHYADVSASLDRLAAIGGLTGPATGLLSVGLAPGVTNLLARQVVEATGAREVEIGVLLGAGERHGPAALEWTLDGLGELGDAWRMPFPGGERTVRGFPFSDQHTLPATLPLDRARTGLALDSRLLTALLPAAARVRHRLRPLTKVHVGSDRFAVTVRAGGVVASFSGRRQSRATGVVAALLVERLPELPEGVWHVEQVVAPGPFLAEVAAHGFAYDAPR